MKIPEVIVVGAGGHGKVVADALLAAGNRVLGFIEDDFTRKGTEFLGLPVLGDDSALGFYNQTRVRLANGIGGTRGELVRVSVQQRLEAAGWVFAEIRHPTAIVSQFAHLGRSTQLMANCVVQAGATVEMGSIINSGAIVEHDVEVGAFVHVACNATLCGGVKVGTNSHIGAGAIVRQGVFLGPGTVVGAGAVVVKDFKRGETLIGVPARPI